MGGVKSFKEFLNEEEGIMSDGSTLSDFNNKTHSFREIREIYQKRIFNIDEIPGLVDNGDGTFDCKGDVNLRGMGLKKIPIQFRNVKGSFLCNNNSLTSLKGAPSNVGKTFDCSYNKLTSLEDAPRNIGGHLVAANNKLTTLEGMPNNIGSSIWLEWNLLTSLKGSPRYIKGNFNCNHNKLISLKGSPRVVRRDFMCSNNLLDSLEGAPREVGMNFHCWNNKREFTDEDIAAVLNERSGKSGW